MLSTLVPVDMLYLFKDIEGDGRCVHASLPCSIKLSINLLLNPPLALSFHKGFCVILWKENVAHCFPPYRLHLDLERVFEHTIIPFRVC